MEKFVLYEPDELKQIIKESLSEYGIKPPPVEIKLNSINQVAKRLGKSFMYVKRRVEAGIIRATEDNQIPEDAFQEFIKGRKQT